MATPPAKRVEQLAAICASTGERDGRLLEIVHAIYRDGYRVGYDAGYDDGARDIARCHLRQSAVDYDERTWGEAARVLGTPVSDYVRSDP